MKTWEMIKELSKNPKKKFKRKTDGLEIRNMCGRFNWEPGYTFLGVNDEWEEIKEPVDFMTAIKSGKKIRVEHEFVDGALERLSTEYHYLDEILYVLGIYINSDDDIRNIALNGKWYIED